MTSPPTSARGRSGLRPPAQLYLALVFGVTVLAYLPEIRWGETADSASWRLAILLAAGAAVAQLFPVFTPRNQSYHTTPVLVVAAALLLTPLLLLVVAVVAHIPEWLKERYPWYIQSFNICNYALSGLAAHVAYSELTGEGDLRQFAAGLAAAATFVAMNHVLLAIVLRLARGHSLRDTGLFTVQSVSTDFVLALLGVVVAVLWETNPWYVTIALAPLILVHRTLALPKLEAEARQDPKTELFNARHFSEVLDDVLERYGRQERPVSLLIADLDLLRVINNSYGHLAGDAVLAGVAQVFRQHLRTEDVAARFGGEEFALLLPDLDEKQARVVAERIRVAVSEARFEVDTSSEPIGATISIGVATFPAHAAGARDLMHRADVAAYRAKSQGRNRVVVASDVAALDDLVAEPPRAAGEPSRPPRRLDVPLPAPKAAPPAPNFLMLSGSLRGLVGVVAVFGIGAGLVAALVGPADDLSGLLALIALVAIGQALAVEILDSGTISVTAVGVLAGVALFGPQAALPIALAVCVIDWSARRGKVYKAAFNVGTITLSGLAASAVFPLLPAHTWLYVAGAGVAGVAYYLVNVGLMTAAISLETGDGRIETFRTRFAWLLPHYAVYGVVAGMVAVAYGAVHLLALLVFAIPLILVRKAQLDYIGHTEASVKRLREAAETIESQNRSLVEANALLRDRATEAMESLAAAVDARDSYTAGHSRRVQHIAVAMGRELGLDTSELESLSFAALFHDVGKLAVPDAVLLKSGPLDEDEWWVVRRHSEEGERIIGHLGFLADATPAIRHHHENWDGTGYPDGLRGQEIPIGARILHVADAFDSMITNRVYRPALTVAEAVAELQRTRGSHCCPSCVDALCALLAGGALDKLLDEGAAPAAA